MPHRSTSHHAEAMALDSVTNDFSPAEIAAIMTPIHRRGDRIVGWFVLAHLVIALWLAAFSEVWALSIGVSFCAAAMFFGTRLLLPGSLTTRCVAGIALNLFVILHIYQMHGLSEMHFWYFTSMTMLIIYQDWRCFWPGTVLIILQHILFAWLQNLGPAELKELTAAPLVGGMLGTLAGFQFFEKAFIGFWQLVFHFAIAILQATLCGMWAWMLRRQTLRNAAREQELSRAWRLADEANEAKSLFLACVSHEIRTPLTAILGHTSILLEDPKVRRRLGYRVKRLEIIKRSGEHLSVLINDIIDMSKVERNLIRVDPEPVAIAQAVRETAALIRPRASAKGLSLGVEFAGPIPEVVRVDPVRLRQILVNLLGNAVKFTTRGGVTLRVEYLRERHILALSIHDTGRGLEPHHLERLFRPFTRLGNTDDPEGGAGLGLAISKRLAELLGGDITVESQPGRGSCFTLELPVRPDEAQRQILPDSEPSDLREVERDDADADDLEHDLDFEAPLPGQDEYPGDDPSSASWNFLPEEHLADVQHLVHRPTARRPRVLLADDGEDNRMLVAHWLGGLAEVVMAFDGRQAILKALAQQDAGQPFDLILMDLRMPILDGRSATRALRHAGYTGPIVALTADEDRLSALEAGCDEHLSKPFDPERLRRLVIDLTTWDSDHSTTTQSARAIAATPETGLT
ncbi:integral membrane sensor hybrid histidine kinase [Isosphaera pallida ATCC 43644]|uniref:histidine kinase n=1 Tax=Isosphaera pallida (strain ATCC 43644 / DSM 9630 / IS1B) TaxID=575540 RepID=E8R386_ISOPI|nr:ATP-binding protein [Isosphaera pallida]ADV62605.1 integral membrane sensor hybrid histidine kinase [Isosphaera pallida ATCC 43644]